MDNNTKHKILGMIVAAELQLDELRFDPREFLSKLKGELNSTSSFEGSGRVIYASPQIFTSDQPSC